MEKKFVTKTGGCICGEVTFKVKLDEVPRVFNCHCVDCRKKSKTFGEMKSSKKYKIDHRYNAFKKLRRFL